MKKSENLNVFLCFQGIPIKEISSVWVRTRLTPNTNLERDQGILHVADVQTLGKIKYLFFTNNFWVLKF